MWIGSAELKLRWKSHLNGLDGYGRDAGSEAEMNMKVTPIWKADCKDESVVCERGK